MRQRNCKEGGRRKEGRTEGGREGERTFANAQRNTLPKSARGGGGKEEQRERKEGEMNQEEEECIV